MFTSRPSEPRTVLLWGNRWWLPGSDTSLEFSDLSHAVDMLVDHHADEPKPVRLRLVFQPDTLETVAVACPQGDRETLAAALSAEFPALVAPACAWSHDPVLPVGDAFSTLLHFESQPGLVALATQLALRGLAVDSAWPLATFLHALPDEWTDTGAVCVIAVEAERAVAYRHPAGGARNVLRWQEDRILPPVAAWLAEILDRAPEEPVLIVYADDEIATALGAFAGNERYPGVELVPLAEALARPVVLPRYHPAQLLPRPPRVTAQRALIAASIALLFAAGGFGAAYARTLHAAHEATGANLVRLPPLRAEVAHLRNNAVEIATLRRSIEGGAAGPPAGAFLDKLSTTLPAELTLTSLRMGRRGIHPTLVVGRRACLTRPLGSHVSKRTVPRPRERCQIAAYPEASRYTTSSI